MNTTQKGDLSASKVLAALLDSGRKILIPWGDGQRYDMVIDNDGVFERIQSKTGRLCNGVIKFNAFSIYGGTAKNQKNYYGQIEYFGVYCPQTGSTYLVPISIAKAKGVVHLRIEPGKKGQRKDMINAIDFLLQPVMG